MFRAKVIAASILAACAAASASAATYTFDLQAENSYQGAGDDGTLVGNVLTLTQSGDSGDLTGTFTGKYNVVDPSYSGTTLEGEVFEAESVQRFSNGLGVCNVGACEPRGDIYHTVDGGSSNDDGAITDFVEMAFFSGTDAVDVTLQSLTFGWVGGVYGYGGDADLDGAFEILVSELSETVIDIGAILLMAGEASGDSGAYGLLGTIDLPDTPMFTDNLFGIKAGKDGSWKLTAATVSYNVPEVPLPAAGWLLIGGLGGLAALRRARK